MDIIRKGIIAILCIFLAVSCERGSSGEGSDDVQQIVIPDKEGMTVKGMVINSQTRERPEHPEMRVRLRPFGV